METQMEVKFNNEDLGKAGYDAYVVSTGGVSLITGDKLPEFHALKEAIQNAWIAAGIAVARQVCNIIADGMGAAVKEAKL